MRQTVAYLERSPMIFLGVETTSTARALSKLHNPRGCRLGGEVKIALRSYRGCNRVFPSALTLDMQRDYELSFKVVMFSLRDRLHPRLPAFKR